ncbi:LysR substrate-binding domain-containing protein [Eleftheria terrae]|uniref:LysR substrate-binding domain-containing protein n=1 Tax=Eleftheria terrae TaxID=1597781 RepID=UPI00263BCE95|nr:LysR substrate-binding domain-containing protein [Eleftheria terrae]WKB55590.1 LysR substrate-binding domain-containing protein [Eleftheria terrae]
MDVLRLTLRQLQIFVAVARHGSTAAAAQQIALSQSATSAAVNELERLLSLQVFDRAGKRLLLNDSGRALLPRALALLDGASDIERLAHDGRARLQHMRIGASTTIGNYVLPGLLGRLFAGLALGEAPAWQSAVAIANTAEIGRRVASFELDIGLVEGPVHEPQVEALPWLRDEMVIVGSTRCTPADGVLPAAALREAVWLLREAGSGTRQAADEAVLPRLRAYRRSIEIGSSEAIKHAAAHGVGLACLSRWVVDDLVQAGRLRVLKTGWPKAFRPCYVVVHRLKRQSAAVAALLERMGVEVGRPAMPPKGGARTGPAP